MCTFCALCERDISQPGCAEKHHLVPRSKDPIPKSKGGKVTVWVCVDCGNQIHRLFTRNELRDTFNTIEALRQDPRIQKWIRWIQKRPIGVCHQYKKPR